MSLIARLHPYCWLSATGLLPAGIFLFPAILSKTYGWRLALSAALWPAVTLILLLPWLPETPSSLIQVRLLLQI
jgi:hypothetical protein